MPLPRTLCRFLLQAATVAAYRSGLVQSVLCRLPDYADQCRRTSFRGSNYRYDVGIIRSNWHISDR
jgi:hypothetical protein